MCCAFAVDDSAFFGAFTGFNFRAHHGFLRARSAGPGASGAVLLEKTRGRG